MDTNNLVKWKVKWSVQKFKEDITPFRGKEEEFHKLFKPFEVIEGEGNLLLNTGKEMIWYGLQGLLVDITDYQYYDNDHAMIGVGDSSAAVVATQTKLQAAVNLAWAHMEATYPKQSSYSWQLQASFGAGEANFAWNEWCICVEYLKDTGVLNRKVSSLGTKTAGTWTFTVTVTLT
ncbi:MAG: hypothetical protein WC329_01675 [Candidatus Omnitrophota bacterium]|jgi:hypothetical protein